MTKRIKREAIKREDDSVGDTTDEESPSRSTAVIKSEEDEDEKKALAILLQRENPKLKVKKEDPDLPLPATTILSLLDGIKPYVLSDAQRVHCEFDVSREFMSNVFGGGAEPTFPSIRKEKIEEHGLNDFMYLSKDYNPVAPTKPGSPGLFFTSDNFWLPNVNATAKELEGIGLPDWAARVNRVLTRLKDSHWLYVGQYNVSFCRALTLSEWENLSQKVKKTWVDNIAERTWSTAIRARLKLGDRLGRRPTMVEVDDALKKARKAKDKIQISKDRVLKALETGEEFILIWTMSCVDYDANFQLRLVNESKTWKPKSNKKKPQKKSNETKTEKSASRKRKRSDSDSDYTPTRQ